MATKIIKAWVDGTVQEIEVEELTSAKQGLSYEDRLAELEDKPIITDGNLLVGNGTTELGEMTPEEILHHINGASIIPVTSEEYKAFQDDNKNTNAIYIITDEESESHTHVNKVVLDSITEVPYTKSEIDSKLSTKSNIAHNHSASEINSGVLNIDRFPIIPIKKGGTGADNYKEILANLHAVETTTEDLTYYVNAASGDNNNDGLTLNTAFKTIQHAIDILPNFLLHSVKIYVAEGTYNEDITLKDFCGHPIQIIGAQDENSSTCLQNSIKYKVNSAYIISSQSNITIQGINFIGITSNNTSIYCNHALNVRIIGCKYDATGNHGIMANFATVYLAYNEISNKVNGISAIYNGKIYALNVSGTNNTYGIYSTHGSIVNCGTAMNIANTAYRQDSSGIIFDSNGNLV